MNDTVAKNALREDDFISQPLDDMARECFYNSANHGFWENPEGADSPGVKIALIHSEVSEALEALRKDPNAPCEKDDRITVFEEEMADAIIRILDLSHQQKARIGYAVWIKHQYNMSRPFKHGKKF